MTINDDDDDELRATHDAEADSHLSQSHSDTRISVISEA